MITFKEFIEIAMSPNATLGKVRPNTSNNRETSIKQKFVIKVSVQTSDRIDVTSFEVMANGRLEAETVANEKIQAMEMKYPSMRIEIKEIEEV